MKIPLCSKSLVRLFTHTNIKVGLSAVTAEPRSSDEYWKHSTSIQSCILPVLTVRLSYLHQANE